ncbi:hypothetical protein C7T35_31250 [Variovorax sp. WS11]|uniref:hypothetical protein n=1 Tax=Variovorax sp. WS11 TaxID=1105204 RepID=UPI000D0D3963|nr:hypothetical protein [Variovorax sp. WS11]NDZ15845.1 hypothetical protein [Variovorax sp. WS11]PSL80652.1 hypothetical protein C7T35_31250 [Variovorax sp. WS11]
MAALCLANFKGVVVNTVVPLLPDEFPVELDRYRDFLTAAALGELKRYPASGALDVLRAKINAYCKRTSPLAGAGSLNEVLKEIRIPVLLCTGTQSATLAKLHYRILHGPKRKREKIVDASDETNRSERPRALEPQPQPQRGYLPAPPDVHLPSMGVSMLPASDRPVYAPAASPAEVFDSLKSEWKDGWRGDKTLQACVTFSLATDFTAYGHALEIISPEVLVDLIDAYEARSTDPARVELALWMMGGYLEQRVRQLVQPDQPPPAKILLRLRQMLDRMRTPALDWPLRIPAWIPLLNFVEEHVASLAPRTSVLHLLRIRSFPGQ